MLLNKYAIQESRSKHEDKPAACLEKINNKLNNSVYQILEIKKDFGNQQTTTGFIEKSRVFIQKITWQRMYVKEYMKTTMNISFNYSQTEKIGKVTTNQKICDNSSKVINC